MPLISSASRHVINNLFTIMQPNGCSVWPICHGRLSPLNLMMTRGLDISEGRRRLEDFVPTLWACIKVVHIQYNLISIVYEELMTICVQ